MRHRCPARTDGCMSRTRRIPLEVDLEMMEEAVVLADLVEAESEVVH